MFGFWGRRNETRERSPRFLGRSGSGGYKNRLALMQNWKRSRSEPMQVEYMVRISLSDEGWDVNMLKLNKFNYLLVAVSC